MAEVGCWFAVSLVCSDRFWEQGNAGLFPYASVGLHNHHLTHATPRPTSWHAGVHAMHRLCERPIHRDYVPTGWCGCHQHGLQTLQVVVFAILPPHGRMPTISWHRSSVRSVHSVLGDHPGDDGLQINGAAHSRRRLGRWRPRLRWIRGLVQQRHAALSTIPAGDGGPVRHMQPGVLCCAAEHSNHNAIGVHGQLGAPLRWLHRWLQLPLRV